MAEGHHIAPGDLGIEPAPAVRLLSWKASRDQAAREILVNALVRTAGNVSQAALALAIGRPTLHELLQKYGVNAKDFRPPRRHPEWVARPSQDEPGLTRGKA